MRVYQDWLKDFLAGKTEVPAPQTSDQLAIHSIRRFLESSNQVWEFGLTYTGRLVVRSGQIGADGISVQWTGWITQHDIEMPKTR